MMMVMMIECGLVDLFPVTDCTGWMLETIFDGVENLLFMAFRYNLMDSRKTNRNSW